MFASLNLEHVRWVDLSVSICGIGYDIQAGLASLEAAKPTTRQVNISPNSRQARIVVSRTPAFLSGHQTRSSPVVTSQLTIPSRTGDVIWIEDLCDAYINAPSARRPSALRIGHGTHHHYQRPQHRIITSPPHRIHG